MTPTTQRGSWYALAASWVFILLGRLYAHQGKVVMVGLMLALGTTWFVIAMVYWYREARQEAD